MTPIEWIAAVFAIWIFVKFVILSVKPKEYINWAEKFMKPNNMKVMSYVELILFFLLAYFILQEISVVQFFIAMMAGMFLMAHTMMHYPKVMGLYIKQFKGKKNPNAKIMFDWLIYLLLAAWVLKELFF
jgi:hypothetical protein